LQEIFLWCLSADECESEISGAQVNLPHKKHWKERALNMDDKTHDHSLEKRKNSKTLYIQHSLMRNRHEAKTTQKNLKASLEKMMVLSGVRLSTKVKKLMNEYLLVTVGNLLL